MSNPAISARASARQVAIKRLIALHQEEYEAFHAEERTKRGLPPRMSDSQAYQELLLARKRIAELEAQLP